MPDLTGKTLLGQYRVDAFLSNGGMGGVYRVWDMQRSVWLAMKVLHSNVSENEAALKRLRAEAGLLETLAHPNIVPFYGLYQDDGLAFLLERYIDGPSLAELMRRNQGRPFPPMEVLTYFKALSAALGYAHAKGIVHCDVKPGNILMDRGGGIYLSDFGIARAAAAGDEPTITTDQFATPAYMAPEQALRQPLTPASDIYSLGVLLYQMLTGRLPFTGNEQGLQVIGSSLANRVAYAHIHLPPPDSRQFNPDLPPSFASLLLSALSKNPAERPDNMRSFFEAACQAFSVRPADVPDRLPQSALEEIAQATIPIGAVPFDLDAPRIAPAPNAAPTMTLKEPFRPAAPRPAAVPAAAPTPAAPRSNWPVWLGMITTLLVVAALAIMGTRGIFAHRGQIGQPVGLLGTGVVTSPAGLPNTGAGAANSAATTSTSAPTPTNAPAATTAPTVTSAPKTSSPADTPLPSFGSLLATLVTFPTQAPTATSAPSNTPPPAGTPSAASAPTPLPNTGASGNGAPTGKIVFTCMVTKKTGKNEICMINADGSGWRQLTNNPADNTYPSLAPDGKAVLFTSNQNGDYEIYALDLASGAQTQLTQNLPDANAPAVSPDGKLIVFARIFPDHMEIWMMNRDGSNPHKIIDSGWDPAWSPDSQQILFTNGDLSSPSLYVANADGSNIHEVLHLAQMRGRSDWSPDGKTIGTYARTDSYWSVFLANIDGSNVRRITQGSSALAPSFSPDGAWVAITAYYHRENDPNGCQIFIERTDGTGLKQLTNTDFCNWQPRWGK